VSAIIETCQPKLYAIQFYKKMEIPDYLKVAAVAGVKSSIVSSIFTTRANLAV